MTRAAVLLVSLLAAAGASPAQTPARITDINTTLTGGTWQWPFSTHFVEMGGVLYFTSSDGVHGSELWRTDGTEAGTRIVKDICPGSCSSWIFRPTASGSALYFPADDGAHGKELWKSDGTEAGTVLVKDLSPGLADSTPSDFFEAGGSLYFSAFQAATGRELWKTDGTPAGTELAFDLWPGAETSFPQPMGKIGGTVLLVAISAGQGAELWRFDGSPAGPALVRDINPGTDGSISDSWGYLPGYQPFLVSGSRLYFSATDGSSGSELWASDGTEAGTVLVKDIQPGSDGSFPLSFAEVNGLILFRAQNADHGSELWKSDGTGANTALVKDIRSGAGNSAPSELTVLGSWAYFRAFDEAHGYELWRSDGTEANTTLVKDIRPGSESGFSSFSPAAFAVIGTTLSFFASDGASGVEPWKSDGTEAGTTLLADLNPGAGSSMYDLFGPITDLRAVWGGRWYFRAFDGEADVEVYISDGTPAGTQQLSEINAQASAFEVDFTGGLFSDIYMADRNGTLFFDASDGISGTELWKSDGTEAGTGQVADIVPGIGTSAPSQITALGGSVLFTTSSDGVNKELWISDGTEAGTSPLKDLDPGSASNGSAEGLIAFGGNVYFAGGTPGGYQLWKTDGTEAGTVPVRETSPVPLSPSQLTPVGSLMLFSAAGPGGSVLWRTDGTAAGTFQVLPANVSTPTPVNPDNFVGSLDGFSSVLFSAEDPSRGREIWWTNGTFMSPAEDIRPGPASSIVPSSGFRPLAWAATNWRLAGRLANLFFTADDGISGQELWVAFGRDEQGAVRLRDIFPGPRSSEIQWLTTVGGQVYFVADDGVHGRELWVSNGTGTGTRMVADLVPGEGSSLPEQFQAVGRNLVFSAHTPDHGREPWITDGHAVGTRRFADLAPGPLPSSPISFTLSGPWLYFVATDADSGFELHSVPKESVDGGMSFYTVAPCRLLDTRTGGGPLWGGSPVTFDAAGLCGIPETAQALSVNVAAVDPSIPGELALFRATTSYPGTNTVSFRPGRIRSNNATVHLGAGAFSVVAFPEITVSVQNFNSSVHLVVDVNGYYE